MIQMKIFYRAFDGAVFDTEEECLEHEASKLAYRMFDKDGNPVYDPEEARVIYIYPNGASQLICDFEQKLCSYSGIGFHSTGWFYLCDACTEWLLLSEELIKLLVQGTP